LNSPQPSAAAHSNGIFYGWYIVAVGFLSYMVCAFNLSSTLSVFLKPLTEDLAVSRGVFSLLRSGEIIISAAMAPFVGPWVDRYGGRWLMAIGALAAGLGFALMSEVTEFWQFLILRWTLVAVGGVFMCQIVVTVTISRWFVRQRGRAIAIATLGQGLSKVVIPVITASLFALFGWRFTWGVFGLVTMILVVIPAFTFMRRSPEDMGLYPDGASGPPESVIGSKELHRQAAMDRTIWSRREVLRTRTFWIVAFTYGIANVGIAGLNLHVFAYITDLGFETMVAATVLSLIAMTQLGSTLIWGFLSERIDIRKTTTLMFIIQALGLSIAIATWKPLAIYAGFFIYGIGLGGSQVLQELIWANYYGRTSLGTVRGMGIFVTFIFGAAGAPFFGFLHDVTGTYMISFVLFVMAVLVSALLILTVRTPQKREVAV
jgi:sugar phosphate permease